MLATGCTHLEPPLKPADPSVPSSWAAPPTPVERAWESGLPAEAAARIGWHDVFQDPKLQTLISQALANNRDLRLAVLAIDKARAQYRLQRAEQLPWVGGNATLQRVGGDTPAQSNYSVGVGVTGFELDLFGQVRNSTDAALQQYFAQEATRRSAQMVLIAEVATVYLTLGVDREFANLSRATLRNYQEALALMEKRFSLGAISGLELEQSRTQVAAAHADVARYEGQMAQDSNALNLVVGGTVGPEWLPSGLGGAVSVLRAPAAGLPSEVLLRRPDVQAAEYRLRAANANIGVARAAFFPSIKLTGNLGSASNDLSKLLGSGTLLWNFIPQVTVPIFQAGRLQANLDSAVTDRDMALAQYEKAIQAGFREVADALALTGTLAQRRQALAALVEAATRAEQLSRLRYQAGRDSYLGLLDAQRTLYSAQQQLLAIRLAEQANRVTLYKVLGGGWQEQSQ
jgi:multidrug efflux system outer membrane protein